MDESPGVRIGDAERQRVVDALRRATSDGRLTLDEFAERAGDAYAARTRGELDGLVADLPVDVRPASPVAPSAPVPAPARAGVPGEPATARRQGRRWFVAIMGGSRPRGRWRAAERIHALAFCGGVTVDLREALIETPELEITGWAIMGSVNVVVPKGIPVELDGLVVMGGAHDGTKPGPPIEGAPVVRVRARGLWGGVSAYTGRTADEKADERAVREQRRAEARAFRDEMRDAARARYGHHRHGVHRPPDPPTPPVPPALPTPSLGDMIPPTVRDMLVRHLEPSAARAPEPPADAAAPAPPPASASGSRVRPTGRVLTMMVSDICSSTATAERLGDVRWLGVLQAHNALVREQVNRHGGTEVKVNGDGFLVTFTSARQAVLAAMAVQRAMEAHRRAYPDNDLHVRVGIHTGEVMEEDGDVLGQNVVTAVRIADVARPDEVLVSGLTRDLTDASGDLRFDAGRAAELKGLSRPSQVYAAAWD